MILASNTLGNLTYAYDLAGRRTGVGGSYARTGTPQAASPATYNVNNQLLQWKGASLTYDNNGNLTGDGTNTYTWNARNQLVSISGPVPASFQYDPFGRRVSKTISGMTQYLYDGANPVQEISGTTASANLLTGGLDEYFQRTDSAGARNFLTDALGSTLALADSAGAVQTSYTFEPFGNTSVTGAATTNSFVYTGRELDPTALYFYRARYYNAQLQRFISEDPLEFGGGDVNLYAYTGNSPTNFADPTGKSNSVVHALETFLAAIAAGYDSNYAGALAVGVVAVDFQPGSQDTTAAAANGHAMGGTVGKGDSKRYQTHEEACAGAESALENDYAKGDDAGALHDIQDSYSGSHDYQPWIPAHTWKVPFLGLTNFPTISHDIADAWPHADAIIASYYYLKRGPYGPTLHGGCAPYPDPPVGRK